MDRVEAAVKHALAINRLVYSWFHPMDRVEAAVKHVLAINRLGILLVSSHGPGGSCCEARPSNKSFGYTLGFIPWTGWKLL